MRKEQNRPSPDGPEGGSEAGAWWRDGGKHERPLAVPVTVFPAQTVDSLGAFGQQLGPGVSEVPARLAADPFGLEQAERCRPRNRLAGRFLLDVQGAETPDELGGPRVAAVRKHELAEQSEQQPRALVTRAPCRGLCWSVRSRGRSLCWSVRSRGRSRCRSRGLLRHLVAQGEPLDLAGRGLGEGGEHADLRGRLNAAIRCRQCAAILATSIVAPDRGTTKATTISSPSASRPPTTAASSTSSCSRSTLSTSAGDTQMPPALIMSLLRPTKRQ